MLLGSVAREGAQLVACGIKEHLPGSRSTVQGWVSSTMTAPEASVGSSDSALTSMWSRFLTVTGCGTWLTQTMTRSPSRRLASPSPSSPSSWRWGCHPRRGAQKPARAGASEASMQRSLYVARAIGSLEALGIASDS
jgi:hypothetical protein